jgi:hypothetical protein
MSTTKGTAAHGRSSMIAAEKLDELIAETEQLALWIRLLVVRREKLWDALERLNLKPALSELQTCYESVRDANLNAAAEDLGLVRRELIAAKEAA